MASTSETGHARNVAQFKKMLTSVRLYGPPYNPADDSLKLPQLEALLLDAQASIVEVTLKKRAHDNSINHRKALFKDLKPFSSRLINVLKSSKISKDLLKDALFFTRKMRGGRAVAITTQVSLDVNTPPPNKNSTSQQSFTQVLEHFAGLIALLDSAPSYRPNEVEMQVNTLRIKQQELDIANEDVDIAGVYADNIRAHRDNILYKNPINLYDVALEVKNYVRGVFGPKSSQYKQIQSLKFNKMVN